MTEEEAKLAEVISISRARKARAIAQVWSDLGEPVEQLETFLKEADPHGPPNGSPEQARSRFILVQILETASALAGKPESFPWIDASKETWAEALHFLKNPLIVN